MVSYAKPLPAITPLTEPFWRHARELRLAVQICAACGDMHFPPAPHCPKCLSTEQSWQAVSGNGTVESWIDVHRAYWDGFKAELPYRVCLVRLDEGPLLVSNLPIDSAPRCGARVRVVFETATPEITLPKFAVDA